MYNNNINSWDYIFYLYNYEYAQTQKWRGGCSSDTKFETFVGFESPCM